MRVCLGGTFEPFHAGHRALLRAAAQGASEVFVGITDGELADRKGRPLAPWPQRAQRVEAFLRESGYRKALVTRALRDPYGPAAREPYDAIACSPETRAGAEAINQQRRNGGLPPLRLLLVPHVLGEDLLPVSATAVHAGLIDAEGKRLKPVRVIVGSANPVKVDAVRVAFASMLPTAELDVEGLATGSGVPEQPKADETLQGARNRAHAARRPSGSGGSGTGAEADYFVGVEAGLVRFPGEEAYLEAQACVVLDRNGWETHGWGPAFHYPAWVTQRALKGEMVSDILGPVAGDPRIGGTTGAIGFLSDGRMDRRELTRIAVVMALLPRLRRQLYQQPEAPGPVSRP